MKSLQIVVLVLISAFATAPADARARHPVLVEAQAPACQGGYLAQTQAQDYLRDDMWVLEPVPGSDNRPYRFDCRGPVFLRK
ncbi:MAG: hypothetical protein ACR652_07860 [Methylocystis sp.]|uniref:hypothetical protein n=1 Tax=Methylocystis sp. TaxID=1911079 RepID=UPI003DA42FA6